MFGFCSLYHRLTLEIQQRIDEGYLIDQDAWMRRLARCGELDAEEFETMLAEIAEIPLSQKVQAEEPEDYANIRQAASATDDVANALDSASFLLFQDERALFNAVHGAWLGRACGCSLGRPFQTQPFTFQPDGRERQEVERWFKGADAWPIDLYAPGNSRAEKRGLRIVAADSTREKIRAMEPDACFDFWLTALEMACTHGVNFTTEQVGRQWLEMVPLAYFPPSESQSSLNVLQEHVSTKQNEINNTEWGLLAGFLNPFREDVSARSRGELYGLLCLGMPMKAAELACRDTRFSHTRNGIYGAMFSAALVATAFIESEPGALVRTALAQIPAESRLAQSIGWLLEAEKRHLDWADCWDEMRTTPPPRTPNHVIPNTLIAVMALLYGKKKFEKTLGIAACGGYNAAANGAMVGTVLGVLLGTRGLPPQWTTPLGNKLKSHVLNNQTGTFTDCAKRTLEAAKLIREGLKQKRKEGSGELQ